MKKIAFITPRDVEYGFGLTGVAQSAVDMPDAEEALKKTLADSVNGLVIIDERLIQGMPEDRLREIEQGWRGILLVLPSPVKPPGEIEDYAARLIRRAIGYHVKIKL